MPVVVVITVLVVFWLGWGTWRNPEALWAPGDLSRYHADVANCTQCHQPFYGPTPTRCIACHSENQFVTRAKPSTRQFHLQVLHQRTTCLACHTEHRGALAQITTNAMYNPHGEFIFRATGAGSCAACHDFGSDIATRPTLLDNSTVRHLLEEGEGHHRLGRMVNCLTCHVGGRLEPEED